MCRFDDRLGGHRVHTSTDEIVVTSVAEVLAEVEERDGSTEEPAEAGHHAPAHLLGVATVGLGGLPRVDLGLGLRVAGRPEGHLVLLEAGNLDGQVGAFEAMGGLEVGVTEAKRFDLHGRIDRGLGLLAELTHGASPHFSPVVVESCGIARLRFKRGLKRRVETSFQFPFEEKLCNFQVTIGAKYT